MAGERSEKKKKKQMGLINYLEVFECSENYCFTNLWENFGKKKNNNKEQYKTKQISKEKKIQATMKYRKSQKFKK